MLVTICVRGKWHAFRLAEQLARRAALRRIVTGYPRFKLRGLRVPPDMVVSLPTLALQEALHRIPVVGWRMNPLLDYWNRVVFDRFASRYVGGSDLVVSWAGSALHTIKKAAKNGIPSVLECGAVHTSIFRSIVAAEYAALEIALPIECSYGLHPKAAEYELAEYDLADAIAVPSEFVRQSFVGQGIPSEKIIKVPYGVDCSLFRPIAKPDRIFRVVYAGTISVLKGIHYLLQAWNSLKPTANMELALVGRIAPDMQAIVRRHPNVRLVGRVDQRQLYRAYSSGSVFVFPSLGDGWPLVLGEAMACGLPVVCTCSSGAAELVRNGVEGYVINPRDPHALAERLTYLLEHDDHRREMGEAAGRRASTFSWDRYGEEIYHRYCELAQ